jgi:signal transduction histidine kinase/CheY-like chemotaxis protein
VIAKPSFRWIVLGAGALATLMIASFVRYELAAARQSRVQVSLNNSKNLAAAIAGEGQGLIAAVDTLLLAARGDYLDDPAKFHFDVWTARQFVAKDLVVSLTLIDQNGDIVQVSDRSLTGPPVNVRDRDYFRAQAEGAGADRIFISNPLIGRLTAAPIFPATRGIYDNERRFRGVVLASINSNGLYRSYDSVDLGPEGAIGVIGEDGVPRAVAPKHIGAIGKYLPLTDPLYRANRLEATCAQGAATTPGRGDLAVCVAPIRELPLYVMVGQANDRILGDFYASRMHFIAAATVITVLIWCCVVLLLGRDGREKRAAVVMRRIDEQLATQSTLLDSTLNNMSQGILLIGPDRTIEVINNAVREMLELPSELGHIGESVNDLRDWLWKRGEFGEDGQELPLHIRNRVRARVASQESRVYVRRRPNGRYLKVRTTPLPHGAVIRTHTDVTELVEIKNAAEAANLAKSHFLATMSHEIRTPLNGVIGMSSLLEEAVLPAEHKEHVRIILQSGRALLELIDDILDFSKLEAGKIDVEHREFDPISVVESVMDIIEPEAVRKGVSVEMALGERTIPKAIGDPTRLRQVFLNLAGNAVKFTQTGFVRIVLTVLDDAEGNSRLRFEVRDSGLGVPEHLRDRLFKDFMQIDSSITRRYGGTGLGLAICKRLVEVMSGAIGMAGLETGSLFWFEVPVEVAPEVQTITSEARYGVRLLCSAPRRREAAISVLTNAGLTVLEGEEGGPDLTFIDAECLPVAPLLQLTSLRTVIFGAGAAECEALDAVRIRGALTPSRVARALHQVFFDPARMEGAPASAIPLGAKRILVAEDYPTNQEVLKGILGKLGHRIDIAENGAHALQMVKENDYDLVFMDVQMPEMDGLEATRRIRALRSDKADIRILAMTASAMKSDQNACLAAGMDGYLSRPVDTRKIVAALGTS